jgi:hypothetical protein
MTSSVDPTAEIVSIKTRLDALTGLCYMGIEQGTVLPKDGRDKKTPYRDFEPGSVIPSASGRMMAAHEQEQPYIWAFQVHHFAPTRTLAIARSIETDKSLIGWEPSTNAGPISTFFFNMYDEMAENGARIGWIATRFYQTTLGQNPGL